VAYTVRGSGPPLLWISGHVVPATAFDEALERLSDAYTIVAADHRGTGRSRSRLCPTTTGTMAADALSVLAELGIEAAHVVGVSLGGMVAQELAIAWPHRTRSLVLCSTTAGGVGAQSPSAKNLLGELRRASARIPGGAKVRVTGAFHQAWAATTHDATKRLERIKAPTLVLHGSQDELVPVANATWLASRIPGADLEVVQGGTHLLALESSPAQAVLRLWLDDHQAHRQDAEPPSPDTNLERALALYRLMRAQTLPLRRLVRTGSRSASRLRTASSTREPASSS